MKLISWNVNGLRACIKKGFEDFFKDMDADVYCVQETKMQEGQVEFNPEGYSQYWNSAIKKGYSGTAIFTRVNPLSVSYDIGQETHTGEGRVITVEFEKFYLVNVYTPNSKKELARLEYRMEWDDAFRNYLLTLDEKKPVIVCGDLNVAHTEIDLKNPKSNRKSAGFSDEERAKMTQLLGSGFTDSYRYLYPEETGAYTWWSYMYNARANNAGWRIDYFVVSDSIKEKIKTATIHSKVLGSDHCPVGLEIKI